MGIIGSSKKKETKSMPMSMAGLVMHQADLKNSPKIKPEWVIIASFVLVAIELTLKFLA